MVKMKSIIKTLIALIYVSGVSLATEQRLERESCSLSQMLVVEPQALAKMFGVETFFRDKKKTTNTLELELAAKAFRIANTMLVDNKGEEALGALGLALYYGYFPTINLIYHIGFGYQGHNFEGIKAETKKKIRQQFLEACKTHGITQNHLNTLTDQYRKEWNENRELIEAIEAEQNRQRRWGLLSGLVLKAQGFFTASDSVPAGKKEQTVSSSEKEARKRTRSQETPQPYLKSRQRKVADDEHQPLLQAGETEEALTSDAGQQRSSISVRQRKPISLAEQPLSAAGKTQSSIISEAKKGK